MVQLMNFHFYVGFEVIYIQQILHYEFCSFPRLWIQKKASAFPSSMVVNKVYSQDFVIKQALH